MNKSSTCFKTILHKITVGSPGVALSKQLITVFDPPVTHHSLLLAFKQL